MLRGERRSSGVLRVVLAMQLAVSGPGESVAGPATRPTTNPPNDEGTIAHVLSRLTFGVSPADIARVKQTGLAAWIDAQLRPAAGEDKTLAARLASLATVSMATAELREKYEIPSAVRQQIQKARAERDEASDKVKEPGTGRGLGQEMGPGDPIRAGREELIKRFPELSQLQGRPQQVISELQSAKVLRAAFAERQLEEVMVDFWFNHFNVYARKGPIEFMVGEYEQTLRKNALGRFEDLLVATAKSPAMLFYLDNWQSTDPNFSPRSLPAQRRGQNRRPGFGPGGGLRGGMPGMGGFEGPTVGSPRRANAQTPRRTFGINENYARELMELHTLGVDSGYTQADVVEVAKAFTGWTILGEGPGGPRRNKESRFGFEEARHVKGDKHVLGETVRNGGEKEGLQILHRLATHPSTAKFIATKLVRRFVSDDPPPALVLRTAAVFEKTGGDIREVVRTIVTSDEFLGPSFRAAKVKTPLEFVVSAVRASGASVLDARDLAGRIADMGMPLYLQQPPTGYKDTAEEWISTSALLERMNFALDLSAGRIRGVRLDNASFREGTSIDSVAARILPGQLSTNSKQTLEAAARQEGSEPARLVGLVLGSPEFQRR